MVPPSNFITLMFMGIGPNELLIILIIIVVLFGASKIPQLARGLGKGITEFKRGLKDEDGAEEKKEIEEESSKKEDPS
jgi:sec-independent protein translocase protein TatA